MDKQLDRVKEYYKECDKSYQHWGGGGIYSFHHGYWNKGTKTHLESMSNMNKALAERLKIKAGDKILDAGCGVGHSSIWLAKNYQAEITGITISDLQCEKANIFAQKEGLSGRVKFLVRDFQNPGFEDNSFDLVWSLESLCHGDNKAKFIEEAYRVLKTGGRLLVADYFLSRPYSGLNFMQKWLVKKWLKGWCLPDLWSDEDFKNYMARTNYRNIDVTDITKHTSPSSKEVFKRGYRGYLSDKYIRRRSPVQMAHVAGCVFQYLALKTGAWKYQIIYGEK